MQETWQETRVRSLGQEDLLEKEMTTHSRVFARKSHGQKSLASYSPWGHKEIQLSNSITTTVGGLGKLLTSEPHTFSLIWE